MERASYKNAVQWIAVNDTDKSTKLEIDAISEKTSVILIAHIFQEPVGRVAIDVIKYKIHIEQLKTAYKSSIQKKTKLKVKSSPKAYQAEA